MQVRQRVSGGNNLQVSYTFSRAMLDGCSGVCISGLRAFQRESVALFNETGRSLEYSYNPTDSRHNLAISASVALPFEIQVSGIGRFISGSPRSATCGCDLDGDGINDRAPDTGRTIGRGDLEAQLEAINAFRRSRNLGPLTMDQIEVLPAAKNLDLRVTKRFGIGEGRSIEFFAEAFNITNVVNVIGQGDNYLLPTWDLPTGAQDARQIQWGARFSF